MSRWKTLTPQVNVALMAETMGISPTAAAVLANRGVNSRNAAVRFLRPLERYMHDPALFMDMDKAASITENAVTNGKKIVVYGDYDVDGVSSTVILLKTLRFLKADVSYYIPHREREGYGLNEGAVRRLAESGANLIIACDNGISSLSETELAVSLGLEAVIIDHHEPGFIIGPDGKRDLLPSAGAVVDHKRADCAYPYKQLCAAAMCYKFAQVLLARCAANPAVGFWEELLSFAAIATVCDIVPLLDENRIITVAGLEVINRGTTNTGLKTFIDIRGLTGKRFTVYDAGFVIGPCINAAGRLDSAELAVELFTTADPARALALATKLSELNDARKQLTNDGVERAMKALLSPECASRKVYVVYDPDMPESVAGIVAGRVKDATNHPTLIITKASVAGLAKGSARSIPGYDMFKELYNCRELFLRFGGHAMAAGLTLKDSLVPELADRLNAACVLTPDDFEQILMIDGELSLGAATMKLAEELERLAPFGKDCDEPLFAAYNVVCDRVERIGNDKRTLRFTFSDGFTGKVKGVAFGMFDSFQSALMSGLGEAAVFGDAVLSIGPVIMDIAFNVGINEYNGLKSLQLKVRDVQNIKWRTT